MVNPGRDRVLVYFGGNGERLDPWRDVVAHHFPDHTTYLMAYRGYGASDGEPSQQTLSADAVALVDHVTERHSRAPVDVLGRSLGSGVAMHVATQRTVTTSSWSRPSTAWRRRPRTCSRGCRSGG